MKLHIFIVPLDVAQKALEAVNAVTPFTSFSAQVSESGELPATHAVATRNVNAKLSAALPSLQQQFPTVIIQEWDTEKNPERFEEILKVQNLIRIA